MHYRPLGRSGLLVSELSLGSWLTYGGDVDARQSRAIIHRAFERGVNLFDTADVYSDGRAEEVLGEALAELPRAQVVVATKVRGRTWPGPLGEGLTRKHLRDSLTASLRRLRLDYLDLYQVHWPDAAVPLEETLAELDLAVRRGQVLHVGCSNYWVDDLHAALRASDVGGLARFVSQQPPFSLLDRRLTESGLLALCAREGVGVICYSPLAQGVLTGKYEQVGAAPAGTSANRMKWLSSRHLTEANLQRVAQLKIIAQRLGRPPAQVALAWVLGHEGLTSAIIGARTLEQLEENLPASGLRLDARDREELDALAGVG